MDVFIEPRFESLYARHPLVLVDAGARGGLKKDWQSARRHLRTIGFEPDAAEFEVLSRRPSAHGDRVFGVALGATTGPIELHVTRDRGLSSVFEPNRAFLDRFPDSRRFDVVERRTIQAQRLDEVLEAHGETDVDFLKVDTQGSELPILQGAVDVLRQSVLGLEVEVEFAPMYVGQPLFADVDAFLRPLGFDLFDLRPCYWKCREGVDAGGPFGQMVWADALYLRRSSDLADVLSRRSGDHAQAKLLKALTVALVFGYHDVALERLQTAGGVLDEASRRAAEMAIRGSRRGRAPLPDFPGKRWLAGLARRGVRMLADARPGWSIGEGRVGNDR